MITEDDIKRAVEIIKYGGLIVYPTETAYGLGVDATNPNALAKFYKLQNRPIDKPSHIVVADIATASKYVMVSEHSHKLAAEFLPGSLTIVMESRGVLPSVLEESGKLTHGIRIPDHPAILEIVRRARVPITAASANKYDNPTSYSVEGVRQSFGSDFSKIDVVLDDGPLLENKVSTFVSLVGGGIKILREGPITESQIREVLGE